MFYVFYKYYFCELFNIFYKDMLKILLMNKEFKLINIYFNFLVFSYDVMWSKNI